MALRAGPLQRRPFRVPRLHGPSRDPPAKNLRLGVHFKQSKWTPRPGVPGPLGAGGCHATVDSGGP
eukprot:4518294-Alexandrium_andersonii.AAC.1